MPPAPSQDHDRTPAAVARVDDPADPRIAVYANQKDAWLRARHRPWLTGEPAPPGPEPTGTGLDPALGDLFIAEGDKVVAQLLESPHALVSVLLAESRFAEPNPATAALLARLPGSATVYLVPRAVIDAIAGFRVHRGLLACGRRTDPGPAAELLARSRAAVVLEDLANHDNVGGVFRAARALAPRPDTDAEPDAGSDLAPVRDVPVSVMLSPRCCDPLYRKALRVSMGNALAVPFQWLDPWPGGETGPGGLAAVAEAGLTPLGLSPDPAGVELHELMADPPPRPAWLLGAEGPGLRPETIELARRLGGTTVRIDIDPAADSLNVAAAAAVALHAWRVAGPSPRSGL